jgi:hypothetical protein
MSNGMDRLADKTKTKTDELLKDVEAKLRAATDVDLAGLRPQVSDRASFDALINAVKESTAKNESIAQLKQRLTDLGAGVVAVAKEVAPLLKAV